MSGRSLAVGVFALAIACGGAGVAQTLPTYPTTTMPNSTEWYPDRYPPGVFSNAGSSYGRQNVLQLGLSAADGQTARVRFAGPYYNTQGRKILVGDLTATTSWIGSLYIPSSWQTPSTMDGSLNRRSELWATMFPASGGDTCAAASCNLFPIIGFSNGPQPPDSNNAPGTTPRYRVWDSNNGGFNDLATPVVYDAWTDFCVTFTGSEIEYRIGNMLVYTATDLVSDLLFGPSRSLTT
jgi:hypothetical protein